MDIVGLFGLIYAPREGDPSCLPLFAAAFVWVEFWSSAASAPYSALIPDIVNEKQRGTASGWYEFDF
jgi:hypothetical protein